MAVCETFAFNHKSINPLQIYSYIIESWAWYSVNICYSNFIVIEFLISFCNVFNSKAIKVYDTITIHIQSYPMGFYWFLSSRLITHASSFILGKHFLETTQLNSRSFDNFFVFQNYSIPRHHFISPNLHIKHRIYNHEI